MRIPANAIKDMTRTQMIPGYDNYSRRIETEHGMGYHEVYNMTQNEYMLAMKYKERGFE